LIFAIAPLASAAMLSSQFKGRYGGLEIYDAQSKLSFRVNTPRLSERLPPCATYLVPHMVIALGTGVLKENEAPLAFDAAKYADAPMWPSSWRREQTFDSALKDSVRWYAQELAQKMGSARITANLKRIKYGNADITGGLDKFWMSSSLLVTSFEQIDFMKALRDGKLGFNPRINKLVQDALVVEKTVDYTIFGKYGSCPMPDGKYLGWLVGYIERAGKVWYYALNLDGKSVADFSGIRLDIVRGSMIELGFLPEPPAPLVPVAPALAEPTTAPVPAITAPTTATAGGTQ
jgi:beta-lactamase class D